MSSIKEAQALNAPPSTPPRRTATPEPQLPPQAEVSRRVDPPAPKDNCTPSSELSSPPVSIIRHGSRTCSSTSLSLSDFARSVSTQTPASTVSGGPPACVPIQSKTIIADGVKFDSWPVAARPDVPTLGEAPRRLPNGSIKPRTKREAEDQLEFRWQKKRKCKSSGGAVVAGGCRF